MVEKFTVIEGGFGGSGPRDPMLVQRVGRLEEDVKEIRGDVRVIRGHVGKIEERLARIEGGFTGINAKLDALPTIWTFTWALIIQFVAIIGVVAGILALLNP